MYYTITNIETNSTIGGTSTKIGGTDYGTEYESLIFETQEIELEPGKYKIEFTYRKDSSTSRGLDKGYIRNLEINTNNYKVIGDERTVVTDENGKINLNLKTVLCASFQSVDNPQLLWITVWITGKICARYRVFRHCG